VRFAATPKRPANPLRLLGAIGVSAPEPGIWLGISAGREKYWNERVAFLREFPTEVRWISVAAGEAGAAAEALRAAEQGPV
jgi:hypothetical protein